VLALLVGPITSKGQKKKGEVLFRNGVWSRCDEGRAAKEPANSERARKSGSNSMIKAEEDWSASIEERARRT